MPKDRYALRLEKNGKWTVLDNKTSRAAHHRNHVMSGMGQDEADAMTDLLNQIVLRRDPKFSEAILPDPPSRYVDEGGMRSWATHRPL